MFLVGNSKHHDEETVKDTMVKIQTRKQTKILKDNETTNKNNKRGK